MPARSLRWLAAVLLSASSAWGGENFYQIVDPNGRILTIPGERSDTPQEAVPAEAGKPAVAEPAAKAKAKAGSKGAAKTGAAPSAAAKAAPATAAYDSEDYTDIEALESDRASREPDKSRFYFIDDQGPGVTNLQEGGEGVFAGEIPLFGADAEALEEDGTALPDLLVVREAEAAFQQWPSLPRCLEARLLERGGSVDKAGLTFILDRKAYRFPDAPGILRVAKVTGEGPRGVSVRSFSVQNSAPAYAVPPLALLDGKGCLTRVQTGYAQRAFPATASRYPMLEGEILMHAEERYLVLLALPDTPAADMPYLAASHGQLMISLKK